MADWVLSAVLFAATLQAGLERSQIRDLTGDETWTRLLARLPLSESIPFLIQDGKHPPLYPLLQFLTTSILPDTALGLRLHSLLAIALLPVVIYWFAKALGESRVVALVLASWIALHPVLLDQSTNARSYALFTLSVALYSSSLVRWLMTPDDRPRFSLPTAILACLTVFLHAFGALFVISLSLAGFFYLWASTPVSEFWAREGHARVMALIHAPAMFLGVAWFLVIAVATRSSGGIEGGLEWLTYPDLKERVYFLGLLLGNPGFPNGTSLFLWLWGTALASLLWIAAKRGRWPSLGLMILAAGLLPFGAQVLASGIILTLPLWGVRHVTPTPVLLVMGMLLAARTLRMDRPRRVAFSLFFGGMGILSAVGGEPEPRTVLSRFAGEIRRKGDPTPILVADQYGALSVLNFYLDPDCLDTRQFRVQFPQVAGPASALPVGAHCMALALEGYRFSSETRLHLVYRDFVPKEVLARDRLLRAGWRRVSTTYAGIRGEPIIELLERTPLPTK